MVIMKDPAVSYPAFKILKIRSLHQISFIFYLYRQALVQVHYWPILSSYLNSNLCRQSGPGADVIFVVPPTHQQTFLEPYKAL